MHLHYWTLKRQVEYLQPIVEGSRVRQSFTQIKNEWIIEIETPRGGDYFLECRCDPQFSYFILSPRKRRRAPSTEVMEEIVGAIITRLQMTPQERIITIDFHHGKWSLYLQYFTLNTNFFLVQPNGHIVNSFKKRKKWIGTLFQIPTNQRVDPLRMSAEGFLQLARRQKAQPLAVWLKTHFVYLTTPVIEELLFRASLNPSVSTGELSEDQAIALHGHLQDLSAQFQQGSPHLYFQGDIPQKFTLGAFHRLSHLRAEIVANINDALRRFCFHSIRFRDLIQKKQQLEQLIDKRCQRVQSIIQSMQKETTDWRPRQYQKFGRLLLSQPQHFRPGRSIIELVDYFDPALPTISVKVKPDWTLQQNASWYFQKAREWEQRHRQKQQRIQQLHQQQEMLTALHDRLQHITSPKKLQKFQEELKSRGLLQPATGEASEYHIPYRTFQYHDHIIWVGKRAADNDLLTFGKAHKEDWWLHVQGYSGSHVILRNPRKLASPPPDALHYAAQLAVTFSKARHARYVPVLYTKVKYVRKPRKSPPGTVIPTQTKTLFVDPLPEQEL